MMRAVGLTGGIGCGKSSVARIFAESGWRIVESDAVVRRILLEDTEVREAVRDRWGGEVFDADGRVDRRAVAQRVFGAEEELQWLEDLLHPRVRAVWTEALAEGGDTDLLVEIPLLFEKKLESCFDLVVCVACPDEIVMERMLRRGWKKADVERRRARQMPLEEKIRRADRVILNAGKFEFLRRQAARVLSETTAE